MDIRAECVNGMTTDNELSQYGITWTFDQNYECGQFFNGDYYVIGPVNIVDIDPFPENRRHGSMINPGLVIDSDGTRVLQAYDDRIGWYAPEEGRPDALKVPPFTLSVDESLVSTISLSDSDPEVYYDAVQDRYEVPDLFGNGARLSKVNLKTAAVLTCLGLHPTEISFRPPYADNLKPIIPVSQADLSKLPDLEPPTGIQLPNIDDLERLYLRPWLQHIPSSAGELLHPIQNMPQYHDTIMDYYRDSVLMTLLDVDKETMVLNMIQNGLDAGYMIQHGRCAISMGKTPIVIAGYLLDHPHVRDVFTDGRNMHDFKEDYMTYYVDDAQTTIFSSIYDNSVGETFPGDASIGNDYQPEKMALWRQRSGDMEHEHLHPSEWHLTQDGNDPGGIKRESYRNVNSPSWMGIGLSMSILGLEEQWNHPAYFDYTDRWLNQDFSPFISEAQETYPDYHSSQGSIESDFAAAMYDLYGDLVYVPEDNETDDNETLDTCSSLGGLCCNSSQNCTGVLGSYSDCNYCCILGLCESPVAEDKETDDNETLDTCYSL
ncbi:MAG: hypothetical protein ACLFUO_05910, partial [Candidatus Woesearchaeota archaeon]